MDLLEIGTTIAARRKERKMSQTDLARYTGLSRAFISNLERGIAPDVGIKRVMRILDVFNMEITLRKHPGPPTLDDFAQEREDAERTGR
ncbi:helix-turn-helix domain-containing protein [Desulfoplanes sp.]